MRIKWCIIGTIISFQCLLTRVSFSDDLRTTGVILNIADQYSANESVEILNALAGCQLTRVVGPYEDAPRLHSSPARVGPSR